MSTTPILTDEEGTVTDSQRPGTEPDTVGGSTQSGSAAPDAIDPGSTPDSGAEQDSDTPAPPQHWRDALPWEGKAERADKLLIIGFAAVIAFGIAMTPVKPFLIAHHPIVLEFLTGSQVAIGAGAAFARIGEAPLWLVIAAGIFGMSKFDWLFWLCGRRWGQRVVKMFTPSEKAQRALAKLEHRPWLLRLAVVLSVLPGIPAGAVYAFAGWARMRLVTFIICDAISSAIMVCLVAGLGYSLGQHAVDVVIKIDDYAVWVSVGLIVALSVWNGYRQTKAQQAKQRQHRD